MKRWSQSKSHTTVHNLRFTHSLFIGFHRFLPNFLSSFQVCPGSSMFETVHEGLDLSLRSSRNSISLGAVVGASMPSSIFPGCHGRCLTGIYCPRRPAESSDSHCHFPDSFPRTSRLGNTPL
ncbi:hypothetical protein CRG98_023789 [Punica granatum]|uniref:Uncharacterized protein n=1 Tax=Punica granatum TaxID=22663 RepID=A0A2I0JHT7_PUNGR|nr:hypothetical protein CRG98_023789 [Punica granatum]